MSRVINKVLFDTVYTIAYRILHENAKTLIDETNMEKFITYQSSWRYWFADPLMFKEGDITWIFAERMDRLSHKGTIAVAKIDSNGLTPFTEVLNEAFHLSYPMVFATNGNIYMIPETLEDHSVTLYKAEEFPYKWNKKIKLFENVDYVDTNVFESQGHLYLITNEQDKLAGAKTRTLIFDADRIEEGKLELIYEYHDFDYESRGAGHVFSRCNEMIRPTQCGDIANYGRSLAFFRIFINFQKFSHHKIKEITVDDIKLDRNIRISGLHTYGISNDIEVIDIKYQVFANPLILVLKIIRKIRGKYGRGEK